MYSFHEGLTIYPFKFRVGVACSTIWNKNSVMSQRKLRRDEQNSPDKINQVEIQDFTDQYGSSQLIRQTNC